MTTDAAGRRLRIGLASQAEVRPVVEALFARDATLLSVTPRRKRLEDLFLQVEGEEEPAPGQRATGENEGTRP